MSNIIFPGLLVGIGCVLLVFVWMRIRRKIEPAEIVSATLLNVSEEVDVVLMKYGKINYYYPVLSYEYVINGKKYIGDVGRRQSRAFRVPEIDMYGKKTDPDQFSWRQWSVGGSINVRVFLGRPWVSEPVIDGAAGYESETTALLVGAAILVGVGMFFVIINVSPES